MGGWRRGAVILPFLLLVAACTPEGETGTVPGPSVPPAEVETPRGLALVLPPADGLAPSERQRVAVLVERALDAALPVGADPSSVPVLEPADRAAVVDTVELAVRRVGVDGTVCVLGMPEEGFVELLALYPGVRLCRLPAARQDGDALLAIDLDLERLGSDLGVAARVAAGPGAVVALDGGDAMLDRRWRAGVMLGMTETADGSAPGRLHVVRSAEGLLALLDEQAALLEEGIVPGSAEARVGGEGDGVDGDVPGRLLEETLSPGRALPPVAVVVLDASVESALIIGPLAERGIRVVAPRSVLLEAEIPDELVVMRWWVRWDGPLAALVRAVVAGEPPTPKGDDVLVVEPGPAAGPPSDPSAVGPADGAP